jgi:hypothetical protein
MVNVFSQTPEAGLHILLKLQLMTRRKSETT